ncbi:hypothetical protein JKP88DRAFT_287828 [Tribonema minus]|uniref:Uncharacterized protein n=1 Tax=Tribonema minus TaxID=303371 RepID=A0A835Z8W1_9STRA|nr:hypothetical protein JKP88DRAFT_287828 [Tribonema minus]
MKTPFLGPDCDTGLGPAVRLDLDSTDYNSVTLGATDSHRPELDGARLVETGPNIARNQPRTGLSPALAPSSKGLGPAVRLDLDSTDYNSVTLGATDSHRVKILDGQQLAAHGGSDDTAQLMAAAAAQASLRVAAQLAAAAAAHSQVAGQLAARAGLGEVMQLSMVIPLEVVFLKFTINLRDTTILDGPVIPSDFGANYEGEVVLSGWVSEDAIVAPWTLDTFHALYELRPQGEQFQHARRLEVWAGAQLDCEAALSKLPRGTALVREHKPRDAPLTYIWGRIDGYLKPYWRARHDDGIWEDMNQTEVRRAIALAEAVKQHAQRSGLTDNRPALTLVTSPLIPSDFGANYEGEVVRYHSELTGWSRGKLVKYMPRRNKHTFEVLFNGESRPRTVVLRPGYYTAGVGESQPQLAATKDSAWNIVVFKQVDGELAAATSEVEPVEQDGSEDDAA